MGFPVGKLPVTDMFFEQQGEPVNPIILHYVVFNFGPRLNSMIKPASARNGVGLLLRSRFCAS